MSKATYPPLRHRLEQLGEDRVAAPYTGWTREHLAAVADELLLAVRPYASPDRAQILIPAQGDRDVRPIDGLEGFARTFMLAAFRLAGEDGHDPHGLAQWYADGLVAGVDPENPLRWPRPDENAQAKVEAAALVLGLHLTRRWIWDRYDEAQRSSIVAYLARVIGTTGPHTNWVWFRLVVEQFLASVGGPFDPSDVQADLDAHESFVREGGWYADGVTRAFDYYNGWALHLYPFLWRDMGGGDEQLDSAYRERFDAFLKDAVVLVGADGGPLIQGRSLVYRFGAAAPFWTAAYIGSEAIPLGQARRAAVGIVKHFVDNGVPDQRGILSLGWFDEWTPLAQDYSGTGSPYWASKGLLGLILPASHPVWAATEEPLPGEQASLNRVISAPGWLVTATSEDGLVRVYNHGTDHALPGTEVTDIPLYARLAYSTATFPLVKRPGDRLPDSSVVVLDAGGEASHRTGFERLDVGEAGGAGFGFSRWTSRWMQVTPGQLDFSNGFTGTSRFGPRITVGSIVRGAWEVRVVRVDASDSAEEFSGIAVTGWPVPVGSSDSGVEWRSTITPLGWDPTAGEQVDADATPLAPQTRTPFLTAPVPPLGEWFGAVIELSGAPGGASPRIDLQTERVTVTWNDGSVSEVDLPGEYESELHDPARDMETK